MYANASSMAVRSPSAENRFEQTEFFGIRTTVWLLNKLVSVTPRGLVIPALSTFPILIMIMDRNHSRFLWSRATKQPYISNFITVYVVTSVGRIRTKRAMIG